MILKGSQRGGGRQLAVHLLNVQDNEHVHVHEMRGFVADDLPSAFHEAYAVSRGTRAKQFLFSLSLNPPGKARVSTEDFERAINTIEERLGLQDQPRAIVFHEKDGRRHAHAVWSRIDVQEMKAINLPHYKLRLREVAKELYVEHGWQMPRGFVDSAERDPASFSLAEWQQAKRGGHDPKALKSMFQECWAISDSGKAFAQALKARGYTLARGDRRGYVAVDFRREVYAISKFVGVRSKQVQDKLGDGGDLPNIAQAEQEIAGRMTEALRQHVRDVQASQRAKSAALALRRADAVQRQRQERVVLEKAQADRWARETRERAARLSLGWRGLWDRITGKHGTTQQQNDLEALSCFRRDRAEKDRLIFAQIDERRALHEHAWQVRRQHAEQVVALHRDIAGYRPAEREQAAAEREARPERSLDQLRHGTRSPAKDFGQER